MALITCTECGKEFSEKASACPNCGCPTEEILKELATVSTADNEVPQYEIDEKTIEIAIEKGIVNEPSNLIITAGKYTDSGFLSTLTHILYVAKDSFYLCRFDKAEENPKEDIIIKMDYTKDAINQFTYDYEMRKFSGNFKFNVGKIKADKNRSRDAYYEILKKSDSQQAENFYKALYLDTPYCPKCHSLNIGYEFVQDSAKTKGKAEVRKKSVVTRAGNSLGRKAMIGMTFGAWALTPKKSKYKETKKSKTDINSKQMAICQDCGKSWEVK